MSTELSAGLDVARSPSATGDRTASVDSMPSRNWLSYCVSVHSDDNGAC